MSNLFEPEKSPCLKCYRQKMEKTVCSLICKRLDAFQKGVSYIGIRTPTSTEIAEKRNKESIQDEEQTSPCMSCAKGYEKKFCQKICDKFEAFKDNDDFKAFRVPNKDEYDSYLKLKDVPQDTGLVPASGRAEKGLTYRVCSVEGCTNKHLAKGFCLNHYKQNRKKKISTPAEPKAEKPEEKRAQPPVSQTSLPEFLFTVDFTNYPKMRDSIVETARRYFLTPEHVIVTLIGQGLARLRDIRNQVSE